MEPWPGSRPQEAPADRLGDRPQVRLTCHRRPSGTSAAEPRAHHIFELFFSADFLCLSGKSGAAAGNYPNGGHMNHATTTAALLAAALVAQPLCEARASVYAKHALDGAQSRLVTTVQNPNGPLAIIAPRAGVGDQTRMRTPVGEAVQDGGELRPGMVLQVGRAGPIGLDVRGREGRTTEPSLRAWRSAH